MRARTKNEIIRSLGTNVRASRLQRGLTQEQLAEKAGISPNYLQQIEYGHPTASVVTLVQLALALGVEVGALLQVNRRFETAGVGRPNRKTR